MAIMNEFMKGIDPIALRTAKTLWRFGHSECNSIMYVLTLKVPIMTAADEIHNFSLFFRENKT